MSKKVETSCGGDYNATASTNNTSSAIALGNIEHQKSASRLIDVKSEDVSAMSRSDMQRLLKDCGARANGSNESMRARIRDLISAPSRSNTPNMDQEEKPKDASSIALPAAKKSKPEKRLKRFRSSCPASVWSRIERARTQRLFLIRQNDDNNGLLPPPEQQHPIYGGPSRTFVVLGSTGNVYEVTVCKVPTCNCPDHAKGNICKHILFVMTKVIGLPHTSPYVYQTALLESELREVIRIMEDRKAGLLGMRSDVLANAAVQREYNGIADKKPGSEDDAGGGVLQKELSCDTDCPICFDALTPNENLTFCRAACGTNFHAECMKMWSSSRSNQNGPVTCPACRQPWLDEATGGCKPAGGDDERYTNLGNLQGVSSVRDTSTYSSWYTGSHDWSYKRRRYR